MFQEEVNFVSWSRRIPRYNADCFWAGVDMDKKKEYQNRLWHSFKQVVGFYCTELICIYCMSKFLFYDQLLCGNALFGVDAQEVDAGRDVR